MNSADAIVADVGGTNTRVAFVANGQVVPESVRRFVNDAYSAFDDIAEVYLSGSKPPARMAVAIAGPTTAQQGKLTNRDWTFNSDLLAKQFHVANVQLLNDLAALGHAVPILPSEFTEPLTEVRQPGFSDQALVIGMGTGFNVSPIQADRVFSVEMGHASLPAKVWDLLAAHVPNEVRFDTNEDLFCGRGLTRLHAGLGHGDQRADEIARADTPESRQTLHVMAEALGALVQELTFTYWPMGGMYFNGSLARTLLSKNLRGLVLSGLSETQGFSPQIEQMPAYLLTDDSAALYGCAKYISTH